MVEQGENPQSQQTTDFALNNKQIEFIKREKERIQRFLEDPYASRSFTAASNFMNFFGIASKLGITDQEEEEGYATMLVGNRFMRDKMGQAEEQQTKYATLKDNKFTSSIMGPVLRFLDTKHKEALQGERVYRESMEVAKNNMVATVGEECTAIIEGAMHMLLTEGLAERKEQGHVRHYDESTVNLSEEKMAQWANNWKPKLESAKRIAPAPSVGENENTIRVSILPPKK